MIFFADPARAVQWCQKSRAALETTQLFENLENFSLPADWMALLPAVLLGDTASPRKYQENGNQARELREG